MAIPIIGSLLGIGKTVVSVIRNKQIAKKEELDATIKDAQNARELQKSLGTSYNWVLALRQGVWIFGGYFAQSVLFFDIYKTITTTGQVTNMQYSLLVGILAYFYGTIRSF